MGNKQISQEQMKDFMAHTKNKLGSADIKR